MSTESGVPRISGRVIVLDEHECVLLFDVPDSGDRRMWITPGGRTEKNEAPQNAAARELYEETGIAIPPEQLGTCVARFETVWDAPDGIRYQVQDNYWLLRASNFGPDASGSEAQERNDLSNYRWWPLPELMAGPFPEPVLPVGLGPLVFDLLANGHPNDPVQLPS